MIYIKVDVTEIDISFIQQAFMFGIFYGRERYWLIRHSLLMLISEAGPSAPLPPDTKQFPICFLCPNIPDCLLRHFEIKKKLFIWNVSSVKSLFQTVLHQWSENLFCWWFV